MRVGVFTPLLSQLSFEDVMKKLKTHQVNTVELGTGNYPGNAHCKLSMLDDKAALSDFKKKLAAMVARSGALSSHSEFASPRPGPREKGAGSLPENNSSGRAVGSPRSDRLFRLPRRLTKFETAELGYLSLAARISGRIKMAVGRGRGSILDTAR